MSLTKTVLGVASIEAILLLLLLISSNHSLQRSMNEGLHTRANTTVALLDTTARDAIFSKDLATLESFVQHAITSPDVAYIRIQRRTGTVLADRKSHATLSHPGNSVRRIALTVR